MRNSETLRIALFKQIEGLQDGSVKPETAKATASCAMAICKTVELDLKAQTDLKNDPLKPLNLTSEPVLTVEPEAVETSTVPVKMIQADTDKSEIVLKSHHKGLDLATIARRTGLSMIDVELIIESKAAA